MTFLLRGFPSMRRITTWSVSGVTSFPESIRSPRHHTISSQHTASMLAPDLFEPGIAYLLNALQQLDQPLALVVDDFHFITEPSVVSAFSYFIEYLPAHVHVFVASRTEPPFPTARLLSRQLMLRLDAQDLRFDAEEAGQFYTQCMGLDVRPEVTDELVRRSEGWITALKLAALSLRSGDDPEAFLRRFSGNFQLMDQYLLEEVLMLQPPSVQQFLLMCSILKRMNASLCEAVTGNTDSQRILETLEHSQLFMIPLDEQRGWYRFHHLFAEFLQTRLKRTNPQSILSLHLSAGMWCQEQGFHTEALDYFLAEKQYKQAVSLLKDMTTRMFQLDWPSLRSRLADIPTPYLMEHPPVYFSYMLSLLFSSKQYAFVGKMLQEAEAEMAELFKGWTEADQHDFLGSLYFVKAFYATEALQDIQLTVTYMKQSRQYKPTGTKLVFAQQNSLVVPSLARDHEAPPSGQLSRDHLFPFLKNLTEMVEDLGLAGSARTSLAEWLYEWNDLDDAWTYAKKTIDTIDPSNPQVSEHFVPSWLTLYRVRKAQGKRQEAESLLHKARASAIELGISAALVYFDAELACLALADDRTKPAENWLHTYRLAAEDELSVQQLYKGQVTVRMLTALQQYAGAWALAEKLLAVARMSIHTYYAVGIEVLQVLLLHKTGETAAALKKLNQILLISEPEQFVRTYVDEGKPMVELLSLLAQSLERQSVKDAPSLAYVQQLLDSFAEGERQEGFPSLSAPANTDLTKRELTVLRLLVKGMTNKEIAEHLDISYGTVKTHILNIYGKLQINSRAMAVRKGIEMGLQ